MNADLNPSAAILDMFVTRRRFILNAAMYEEIKKRGVPNFDRRVYFCEGPEFCFWSSLYLGAPLVMHRSAADARSDLNKSLDRMAAIAPSERADYIAGLKGGWVEFVPLRQAMKDEASEALIMALSDSPDVRVLDTRVSDGQSAGEFN